MSGPRLAAKARLKWDRREGRYMLLYPERGLALSESAAAVLLRCDGEHTPEAIVEDLANQRPGSNRAVIAGDVAAFLDEMRRRGLVVDG